MAPVPCIYCDGGEPEKFSGREHVISQAFGTFGSRTPVLKSVCDDCNAYFGKELDRVHARDTLEGVLRYKQGIFSRENRQQRRLRFTLADSSESGELLGAAVGGVDPTNDDLRPLVAQLKVFNRQTGHEDIFTQDQLATLALPEDAYGEPGKRKANVFAPSKVEYDAFVVELGRTNLAIQLGEPTVYAITPKIEEDGRETLGVHIEAEFDALHRRCLGKIFVNFAACFLSDAEVRKPEWKALKEFVRRGNGALAARLSDKPFWSGQETDEMRWPDAINIRLENTARGLVGAIQFYNRITYELLLIEGYQVEREIAARFEAGKEPEFGHRGRALASGTQR